MLSSASSKLDSLTLYYSIKSPYTGRSYTCFSMLYALPKSLLSEYISSLNYLCIMLFIVIHRSHPIASIFLIFSLCDLLFSAVSMSATQFSCSFTMNLDKFPPNKSNDSSCSAPSVCSPLCLCDSSSPTLFSLSSPSVVL